MEDTADSAINKTSIMVSRNRPVAIVANTCTFLGSRLSSYLLEKGIQVIGIDDLSINSKRNLESSVKNKDFHFINLPLEDENFIEEFRKLNLQRLDYGFFITDMFVSDKALGLGVINFINVCSEFKKNNSDKPRVVFSSSINLYGKSLGTRDRILKEAEGKFAKGIKHFKLNGRVVRLAQVFGPGMDFDMDSPLPRLIAAALNEKLDEEAISMEYSERSLYIDDALRLLVKSVLSGATSNKIYDGALLNPVKLSEIKQILLNPLWSEENPPEITKLPPWPTPNLTKTIKELSWTPKTPMLKALRETCAFFKEKMDLVPAAVPLKENFKFAKNWSFEGTGFLGEEKTEVGGGRVEAGERSVKREGRIDEEFRQEKRASFAGRAKRFFWTLVFSGILIYGLIWPAVYLGYEGFTLRNRMYVAKSLLEEGKFLESEKEIESIKASISIYKEILANLSILKKIPGIETAVLKSEQILGLTEEGIDGLYFAVRGSKSLFQTTKIISGESREDPGKYYDSAKTDLSFASSKLSKVYAGLGDESLKDSLPDLFILGIDDMREKIGSYLSLVQQTKTASELMPKVTGVDGKKSYLVLLQNNLELRPAGGFIGSYGKLDFEEGRLVKIKVDDIYNLDGALKEVIAPPAQLKADMGVERLFLRDSNFEPDFPTSARQASFFYKKEAGESVHGVIAMDLKASGNLLDAVGGLDLPEYGEFVNGANLFEKAISHAEADFFPGSQAKKNYLTSLQTQLFNKIFYLSNQNWPAIVGAVGKSLEQKHIMVYLEDPSLFSSLASSNWSGVFPRAPDEKQGQTNDFLAVIESNMGANKANYFLQRKYNHEVSFTKEGLVHHKLKITYKNTSPSEVFPAGIYKNRIKLYVPLGTKLKKILFGETDILSSFTSFSDYGRSGFSSLIQVAPKEQKTLLLEYELPEALSFKDNLSLYRMEIFKQPGTISDPYDFTLTYPINYKLEQKPGEGKAGLQEVKISGDLQTDKVFEFKIRK